MNTLTLTPAQARTIAELQKPVIVEDTNLNPGVVAVRGATSGKDVLLVGRDGTTSTLHDNGRIT